MIPLIYTKFLLGKHKKV